MGSNERVDDKDKVIIGMLRKNARSSLRDIAEVVEMSPSSVRNRIENLVKNGLIKRFTVDVDYRKMGYEIQVIVLITSRPGSSEVLYRSLLDFKQISDVYWTSGPATFVCLVRLQDMNELSQFLTTKLERLEGVERVETMFLMPQTERTQ